MGNPVRVLFLLLTVKLGYSYNIPNPPDVSKMIDVCPKYSVFATNGKDSVCFWCDPYCKDRNVEDCRNLCPEYMEDYTHRKTSDGTNTETPPANVVTDPPSNLDSTQCRTEEVRKTPCNCIPLIALVPVVIVSVFLGVVICGLVFMVLKVIGNRKSITKSNCSGSTANIDPEANTSDTLLNEESDTSTATEPATVVTPAPSNDTDNHDVDPTAPSLPSNGSELEGGMSTTESDQDASRCSVGSGENDEVGPLTLNSTRQGLETCGNRPHTHPAENDNRSNFDVQERGGHKPDTSMSGVPSSAALPLQPQSQQRPR